MQAACDWAIELMQQRLYEHTPKENLSERNYWKLISGFLKYIGWDIMILFLPVYMRSLTRMTGCAHEACNNVFFETLEQDKPPDS